MFVTRNLFVLNLTRKAKMISQSKISSFFKTGSTPKRPRSDSDDNQSKENKSDKKLKTDIEDVLPAVKPLRARQTKTEVKPPKLTKPDAKPAKQTKPDAKPAKQTKAEEKLPKPTKLEEKPTKTSKPSEDPQPSTSWADPTSLISPVTPTKSSPTCPPKDDPTRETKEDPTSSPKDDPTSSPKDDPTSSPKEDPTSSPKEDPTSPPNDAAPGSPARAATGGSPGAALSPEQKERMTEKQLQAKMKLTARSTEGLVRDFGATWFKALQPEFTKPYFVQLSKYVSSERQKGTVFPPPDQVFTFTQACQINEVKVVIIGQDPYHGTGQAHGLSFSVQKGIRCPPSLVNMYKELITDIEGFKNPGHGNLTGWAEQGVLMLNACLTVKAHQANSHQGKGWEKFTDAVIAWFNTNRSGLVFMLWGAYAQKKGAQINKKKHLVLKGVHPSPLSAHRGYFGSKHFSQCNKYLKEHDSKPIDWTHLPEC